MVLITKKHSAPLKHRKRTGQHHKRDKTYGKSYWPYLPLLGIIGLGFVFNLLWTPISRTIIHTDVLDYATNTSPDGLLGATNLQRSDNGQPTLQINSRLTAAAQAKANDMANRNYWSHTTPDNIEPWWFITNAGYSYQAVGENLAYGFDTSAATVTGWMNSPGHRANILNASYQEIGFGIANSSSFQDNGEQTIVVAMYGKPLNAVAAAFPADTPAVATPTSAAPAASQRTAGKPVELPVGSDTAIPLPESTFNSAADGVPASVGQQDTNTSIGRPVSIPTEPAAVSRLQLVSGSLPAWSVATTTILIALAGAFFIIRHLHYLHRVLVRGERYALRHPALDIAIISLITVGFLITRTAGFIN